VRELPTKWAPTVSCAPLLAETTLIDAEHLLELQRELRERLLTHRQIAWRPARDLAAHMLLHLDDANGCLELAVQWMRDAFDADRVDAGFGAPCDVIYRPQAEALRSTRSVPSMVGAPIDAADGGVQRVWASRRVVVYRDIAQERRMGERLRASLLGMGSRSIIATALRDRGPPVGLTCAEWMDCSVDAADSRCVRLQELSDHVLGPIISAARSLRDDAVVDAGPGGDRSIVLRDLTPAERRVAELAATGMSYKEIARRLNRSFSTIDHQLRSVRRKLGARSAGRLVRILMPRATQDRTDR
jgi:DNA-binding CsgD family transcriptional regulator